MIFASLFKARPTAASIGALIIAMTSIQLGAAFAKHLFPLVGAPGATALRLIFASLMMLAAWQPWRMRPSRRDLRSIVVYGLAMGLMNFFFYASLTRIPLGIAVALEFTGPLFVATAASRRTLHFLWVAFAVLGLLALLPLGQTQPLDSKGVGLALGAGACWAVYIVFGQKTGSVDPGHSAALGMLIGAAVIVPVGIVHAGARLFTPALLPLACGVAFLSSALPYSLEMLALTRLPTRTFGVLMSLEPALGALSGWALLGENLSVVQWAAVASIMLASAGSAATSRRRPVRDPVGHDLAGRDQAGRDQLRRD